MIELLLFLGTFCVFFFLPVQFHIQFNNANWNNTVLFELSFLRGWVTRKKEITITETTLTDSLKKQVKQQGRWYWWTKRAKQVQPVAAAPAKDHPDHEDNKPGGLKELIDRYRHFGLGPTLLTYFLPAKYHKWLLVAGGLEKRGYFEHFQWSTRLGVGDAAQTALLSGLLWTLKTALTGYLQANYQFAKQPEVTVVSDFQTTGLNMAFDCIFRVKLGYIIIAAFIARFRHSWLKGGVEIE